MRQVPVLPDLGRQHPIARAPLGNLFYLRRTASMYYFH